MPLTIYKNFNLLKAVKIIKEFLQGVHRDADKSKLLFKVEKIIRN